MAVSDRMVRRLLSWVAALASTISSGISMMQVPDEIVDASAATQLNNLRTILTDTANSASGITIF